MAGELQLRHTDTGLNIYATVTNQAGLMWNGAAFEVLVVANWATYDLAATETPAASYRYLATFPAAITTAGVYMIDFYVRAGGAPLESDTFLIGKEIIWDGVQEVTNTALWDLWRDFYLKHKMVRTAAGAATVTRYHDDGVTVIDTQALSDNGTTQQVEKAV